MAISIKSSPRSKTEQYATLHELLILKLRVLHDVETQLTKALPKMAKAATDTKLKEAFTLHLEETQQQVERIEQALELAGDSAKKKEKSEAIRGLIEDAEWCIKNIKDEAARDAALLASAQYVEHYEIAGYGTARAWSELMGHSEIVSLLEETLAEEELTDTKLTDLAESTINEKVEMGHEQE